MKTLRSKLYDLEPCPVKGFAGISIIKKLGEISGALPDISPNAWGESGTIIDEIRSVIENIEFEGIDENIKK